MKVRALFSFASPLGTAVAGEVLELPVDTALSWLAAGLVAPLPLEPEVAVRQVPEVAVSRKGRR
jgi:hypothetical protein